MVRSTKMLTALGDPNDPETGGPVKVRRRKLDTPYAFAGNTTSRHLSFGKHVAVLTDARFSGVSTGACIGHVSPEALAGGPLGKVRDGDLIRIVVESLGSGPRASA